MTRYENKHTKAQSLYTIYIYIYEAKMTSALKWSQIKEINVFACAWSECLAIASWYVLS